jgi:hypothetical protein
MIMSRELFPNPLTTQQEVDNIIKSEHILLSKSELTQFLFLSCQFSKNRNRKKKIVLVQRHLGAIESSLRRFPSSSWSGKDVSFIINSLNVVHYNDAGVNEFLAFVASVVSKSLSSSNTLTSQGVSMIMYGLRGMRSSSSQLCGLIEVLAFNIDNCKESFNAQSVSNSFYGLQGMSSDSAEVRAMLSALAPKVESCTDVLSAQHVGNALYGLQMMSSDSAEVRAMLSALVPKVESCTDALSAQAVGNALYGLQGMSSNSA